ncbi:unnamed protein product [Hyaloperonospora brassicae]|uniref:DUF423-domain-containing protein n=1 Tax=Hyaloperonospora brassicae TaxID=162125 RepID=A0AAV0UQ20_HYABA|nr:unnamed protein product [Hyaloperonospora brassicae]
MKAAVISPARSIWWKVGAMTGASGVMLGAFGAHALKTHVKDPELLKSWSTAAYYQLIHSAVLLATPLCRRPKLAGRLIATGTMLFSGSIYVMVLTGDKRLGMVTPVGGVAMVAGWLALVL